MPEPATEQTRPRERLLYLGAEALSDAELLAIILNTGVKGLPVEALAASILRNCGGWQGLHKMGTRELAKLRGTGLSKACRLKAVLEIARRYHEHGELTQETLLCSQDVVKKFKARLANSTTEEFWVLPLDAKNRPLGEHRIAIGTATGCPVHIAQVFRVLLREAAVSAIFVHNHPSGDPAPSPQDRMLTLNLVEAGAMLEIPVVDHVIVAKEGHFSFRESGKLENPA